MSTYANKMLNILHRIEGSGDFETSGVKKLHSPGLYINGVGEIGMPIAPIMAKEMIKVAHKAPFGKGSETILDTNVRSAWEINAEQLSFKNPEWEKLMDEILEKVKKGLGIEKQSISASLYKLLIYEKGDFFLPHKDSEKEKGMFATLVVGLPSSHTGGELYIRFDGREEEMDFSMAASNYKIPFVAFFADCEHEIKPVRSGYRVCLVYNLIQKGRGSNLRGPSFGSQTQQVTQLLKEWEKDMDSFPKVVLLGHQYTPANFSEDTLKLHDKPRATALMEAADKAGYFARLGLVTSYLMGELESDYDYYSRGRRGNYYDDDFEEEEEEEEKGSMGEIYEQYTQIEHWVEDELPGLGEVNLKDSDIITDMELADGDPTEQQQEGYTGNAGMTIEYWYHYGAVVLWPKSRHADMLKNRALYVRLNWLNFYSKNWTDVSLHAAAYSRQILIDFAERDFIEKSFKDNDFSVVAAVLAKLEDDDFVKNYGKNLLTPIFSSVLVQHWVNLLQTYGNALMQPIFRTAGLSGDVTHLAHLLKILKAINQTRITPTEFVQIEVRWLPTYLDKIELENLEERGYYYYNNDRPSRQDNIIQIIQDTLAFSQFMDKDENWQKATFKSLTKSSPRPYVNKVLCPILIAGANKARTLHQSLKTFCINDLKKRTAIKPAPPKDWSRAVPTSKYYDDVWKMLSGFLKSPTQKTFDYRANESYRSKVESAIANVTIDLATTTIKIGRPYTLKITKTQTAYKKELKIWQEDMKLLQQLD